MKHAIANNDITNFLARFRLDGRNRSMHKLMDHVCKSNNSTLSLQITPIVERYLTNENFLEALNTFKCLTKELVSKSSMPTRIYNRLIRICVFVYAGIRLVKTKKRINFRLQEMYDVLFSICEQRWVNFYTNEDMDPTAWKDQCRVVIQEHSPSSRQYWCTRTFNEQRNFPLFINPGLTASQNERNWEKGTDGLRRGGDWLFNICFLDENELIRKYPEFNIINAERMRDLIENETRERKRKKGTYRINREPKKLSIIA